MKLLLLMVMMMVMIVITSGQSQSGVHGLSGPDHHPTPLDNPEDADEGIVCHSRSRLLVSCELNGIVRDSASAMQIYVRVNPCHEPVDVAFDIRYPGPRPFKFTFVPENQNERVLVPALYLSPPIPRLPTYLFIRQPWADYRRLNTTSMQGARLTIQASFVVMLPNVEEEVEFLNHTFHLPLIFDCPHLTPPPLLTPSTTLHPPLPPHPVFRLLTRISLLMGVFLLVFGTSIATVKFSGPRTPKQRSTGNSNGHTSDNKKTINNNRGGINSGGEHSRSGDLGHSSVQVRINSDKEPGTENSSNGNTSYIIEKMRKMKRRLEICFSGITFRKLEEDSTSSRVVFNNNNNIAAFEKIDTDLENPNGGSFSQDSSVGIVNPVFMIKILNTSKIEENSNTTAGSNKDSEKGNAKIMKENELFPDDDDAIPSDVLCYTNKDFDVPRSDSYSNIFHISDSATDLTPDVNLNADARNENKGHDFKSSSIVSHKASKRFGYGSKEWLNQLEGATAVIPKVDRKKLKFKERKKRDNRSPCLNQEIGSYGAKSLLKGGRMSRRRELMKAGVNQRIAKDQLMSSRVLTPQEVVTDVLNKGIFRVRPSAEHLHPPSDTTNSKDCSSENYSKFFTSSLSEPPISSPSVKATSEPCSSRNPFEVISMTTSATISGPRGALPNSATSGELSSDAAFAECVNSTELESQRIVDTVADTSQLVNR